MTGSVLGPTGVLSGYPLTAAIRERDFSRNQRSKNNRARLKLLQRQSCIFLRRVKDRFYRKKKKKEEDGFAFLLPSESCKREILEREIERMNWKGVESLRRFDFIRVCKRS